MFSDSPHPISSARKRPANSGFTLIELLMVVAVIMVLAGITFGISRGVQNAQARAQAKAELAVISQSIEQYKLTHGDYPWTQDSKDLAKALMGWMKFERSGGDTTFIDVTTGEVGDNGPKSFIDPTKLSYLGTLPQEVDQTPTNIEFTDPWGNAYVYSYRVNSGNDWESFGYVLYSKGADGDHAEVDDDGILTTDLRENNNNIDNIYSGE